MYEFFVDNQAYRTGEARVDSRPIKTSTECLRVKLASQYECNVYPKPGQWDTRERKPDQNGTRIIPCLLCLLLPFARLSCLHSAFFQSGFLEFSQEVCLNPFAL